jgi:hypothetical protein
MRIDPDCRDPDLLVAEVRRLQSVIAAGELILTDAEREAIYSAAGGCDDEARDFAEEGSPEEAKYYSERAATLRKLLERLP